VHIRKLNNNRVGKNTNSKVNYPLKNGWVTHMVHKLYIKCPPCIWNGIEHESFYFLPFYQVVHIFVSISKVHCEKWVYFIEK